MPCVGPRKGGGHGAGRASLGGTIRPAPCFSPTDQTLPAPWPRLSVARNVDTVRGLSHLAAVDAQRGIARRMVIGLPPDGLSPAWEKDFAAYPPAGVIVFRRDFRDLEALRALTMRLR